LCPCQKDKIFIEVKESKWAQLVEVLRHKVKVKYTFVQALRLCTGRTAHRGCRGIALPFLDHGIRRGEGSTSRPGSSLPPGKTRYPLYRMVDPRAGLDRGGKIYYSTRREVMGLIPGRVLENFQVIFFFCPHSIAL
jgi:hypothetical protein